MEAATSVFVAATVKIPRSLPIVDRMKENSPICARATATVIATFIG